VADLHHLPALAIFGTFLTRSGVVSSVHAFAQSSIGTWFVAFLAIIFATCVFFFIRNKDHLKSEHRLESLVSRESSFLFNNVLLLVAAFAVLWGTLFPVLSEWVTGSKVTVGPPFFNKVNIPSPWPAVPDRRGPSAGLAQDFVREPAQELPGARDHRPREWRWRSSRRHEAVGGQQRQLLFADGAHSLSALVRLTIVKRILARRAVIARAQHTQHVFAGMVQLTRRNTRRYGGYIVHLGVVMAIVGFAGPPFNQDTEKELGYGDTMQIGQLHAGLQESYTQDDKPNYSSEWAILDVLRTARRSTPCIRSGASTRRASRRRPSWPIARPFARTCTSSTPA
jgi:cytochrome c-type biogenesis protein CcmF